MHKEFQVHRQNEQGLSKMELVARAYDDLLNTLEELWGEKTNREAVIARTKLEESCFFAKKALAVQIVNQK